METGRTLGVDSDAIVFMDGPGWIVMLILMNAQMMFVKMEEHVEIFPEVTSVFVRHIGQGFGVNRM